MENTNKRVKYIVQAAIISALYVIITAITHIFGLDSGVIQVRISEALVSLLYFTPAAIPGLFLGCFLSNFLLGGVILDVIFGSIATLIGAILGYKLQKYKYLIFIPNIISNSIIVPLVLKYAYNIKDAFWYLVITVGIGEIISCAILGIFLLNILKKRGKNIFK